jgi:putative ABC transport system ATP-binding protein
MSENVIELKNIKKIYRTEEVETHAVSDVSFAIKKGDYAAISGPSGCGKSTLLSIMGLLDRASSGQYYLNGEDVSFLGKNQLADLRNQKIGFIFQSFNLIESLSVIENVKLPLVYRKKFSSQEIEQRAKEALDIVGMSHRMKHFPTQLSGGQQQRVAVARSIVGNPSIILADEPTGNLDSKSAEAVMELLRDQHKNGATICIVTHDPRYTQDATRTIRLLDGRVLAEVTENIAEKSNEAEHDYQV